MNNFVSKLKDIGFRAYDRFNNRWLDYRYKIPGNAGMCFAYYLLMSVIPICSIFVFLATIFDVDLVPMQNLLQSFLTEEFSAVVIEALKPREINFSSIIAIGISVFVVSRGINQLYGITKSLFPPDHERNFIVDQAITIAKTVFVFLLLILLIALLSTSTSVENKYNTRNLAVFNYLYLFLVFFIVLFLLYKIIPDTKVSFKDVFYGAFSASLLMTLLLFILGTYFGMVNYGNVYGQFASIVIILLSFNFIAEVIYIGMYVMFETHMYRLMMEIKKSM